MSIGTIVCLLFELLFAMLIVEIDIKTMIRNKKNTVFINAFSIVAKLIFSIVILKNFISLNLDLNQLKMNNLNNELWQSTKSLFTYNYSNLGSNAIEDMNISEKSRELFRICNSNGSILANPSSYYFTKDVVSEKERSLYGKYYPDYNYCMLINSQYLKENPIYDSENNLVDIPNEYGDSLIILVPEHYKNDEEEILKDYRQWYQFTRYIDEDERNKLLNQPIENHPEVKVNIKYIKDNQRSFLYNSSLEKENGNYLIDGILIVINSDNVGNDSYISYLSGGTLLSKANTNIDAYKQLKTYIDKADLGDIIKSVTSLYSSVEYSFYELNNNIKVKSISIIIILIMYIILIGISSSTYIEKNKAKNMIKKLHGYSFLNINKLLFIQISISWIVSLLTIIIWEKRILTYMIIFTLLFLSFDILITFVFLKKKEKIYVSVLKSK